MLNKLKYEVKKYFWDENIEFKEINSWRTNTNFFIKVWNKEYFLRTNITKVVDLEFWWKLEKESLIYNSLKWKWIIPEIIYYFDNKSNIKYIITEKIEWKSPVNFIENDEQIYNLLRNFQQINYNDLPFLKEFTISKDFRNLLNERINKVNILELKNILDELTNYLYNNLDFEEELTISHADFRSDNLILSENDARIIDLESIIIWDKYIDPTEYYVWWIFWDAFENEKKFNYDLFVKYMNNFWYNNQKKQKYIFLLKFATNFAWLSSHISQEKNPLNFYIESIERNKKSYYSDIRKLIIN